MIKKIGFLLLLMLVSTSVTGATAIQDTEYTVVPVKSDNTITPRWVTDTITQDQTNWHDKPVSSYTTSLHINLNWGDTRDSLRLKVYSPSKQLIGTFYDSADSAIDGRINIEIRNSNGIETGTWYYEVYGDSVTGTEDYYI
jgi:hypothetical protein